MLRATNLTIEIFIDVDDGTAHAEALMFTTEDRRLLARGHARLGPGDEEHSRMDDGRIAAVALLDLVRALTEDDSADRDDGTQLPEPSPGPRTGDETVAREPRGRDTTAV
jgi:hypothetical protein